MLLNQSDYEGTVTELDRAIELDPRSAWSFHTRGLAYGRLGAYDDALADYNHALELDPLRTSSLRARGYLNVRRGEFESAIADFDQVVALRPYDAEMYSARASAHEELGNLADALRDAQIALWLNPNLGLAAEISERLIGKSGEANPGSVAFTPAPQAAEITYLHLLLDAEADVDPMEESIMDLINWFRPELKPLPENRRFVTHRVSEAEGEITTMDTYRTYASEPEIHPLIYRMSLWLMEMPMGDMGTELRLDHGDTVSELWPLEVGKSASGEGVAEMVCPETPNPMSMMLQCEFGQTVQMGTIEWETRVEGWEDITVPAGTFGAYRISHTENTTLKLFGQPMERAEQMSIWYAPSLNWWVKREATLQGKIDVSVATIVE